MTPHVERETSNTVAEDTTYNIQAADSLFTLSRTRTTRKPTHVFLEFDGDGERFKIFLKWFLDSSESQNDRKHGQDQDESLIEPDWQEGLARELIPADPLRYTQAVFIPHSECGPTTNERCQSGQAWFLFPPLNLRVSWHS